MVKSNTRQPYCATPSRRLVIALDVGTTFSGISFAILDPGDVPKIESVLRYPGQENIAGTSKVPSVLYYDREGTLRKAGAEADQPITLEMAEEEEWNRVEWFKLHLRPTSMMLDKPIPNLPPNVSPLTAFADFLRYLAACAKWYIEKHQMGGKSLWAETESTIAWIISHPNGWQGAQQARLRQAAIQAGLVPPTDEGRSRVHFVTEGEASLHACVDAGMSADLIQKGKRFIVADAGGGTLDISSYVITDTAPLRIEESAAPACIVAGSIFITLRAKELFIRKLGQSRFGKKDAIEHIAKCFDNTTKRLFTGGKEPQVVAFGTPLDKDLKVGIRNGQLKLSSDEVKELFEPSCKAALQAIREQIRKVGHPVQAVLLVGGLAGSGYLLDRLTEGLKNEVEVFRPEILTSKAVAEGAVSFYLDHFVSARIAKYMYGTFGAPIFDPHDSAHRLRIRTLDVSPSGRLTVPGNFTSILHKDTRVEETEEFSTSYFNEVTNIDELSSMDMTVYCYKGGSENPEWMDEEPDDAFKPICKIVADTSGLRSILSSRLAVNGKKYWTHDFDVVIQFGLTEMTACLRWEEKGVTKRSPAKIMYETDDGSSDDDFSDDGSSDDDPASTYGPPSYGD